MKRLTIYSLSLLTILLAFGQDEWDGLTSGQLTYTNGKVGIGTTAPAQKLHIDASYSTIQLRLERTANNVGATDLGADGNGFHVWAGGYDGFSNTDMFISNAGNVGIGTTSPTNKLEVIGNASIIGDIIMDFGKALKVDTDWGGQGEDKILKTGWDASRDDFLDFYVPGSQSIGQTPRLSLNQDGNVGIGTTTPSNKLEVNGTIRSKEVKVEASPWPDYVFESGYNLRTLQETEAYIKENKHLPEVPSAKEIEAEGLKLGEMNMLLLKKIEELTLHTIQQENKIQSQKQKIENLSQELKVNSQRHEQLIRRIEKLEN